MVTDDEQTGGWSCSESALDPEADFCKKKSAAIRRRSRFAFGRVRGKLPPKVGWRPSHQVILAIKLRVIAFSQIKTLLQLKMIWDHLTISVGHYHLFLKWKTIYHCLWFKQTIKLKHIFLYREVVVSRWGTAKQNRNGNNKDCFRWEHH